MDEPFPGWSRARDNSGDAILNYSSLDLVAASSEEELHVPLFLSTPGIIPQDFHMSIPNIRNKHLANNPWFSLYQGR